MYNPTLLALLIKTDYGKSSYRSHLNVNDETIIIIHVHGTIPSCFFHIVKIENVT